MSNNSKIEWTNVTDNVFVVQGEDGKQHGWYCVHASPGCTNCYSERLNQSGFYNGNGLKYRVLPGGAPPIMIRRDLIERWPRLGKPKMHFVNSMTDTFGEFIDDDMIFELFDGMAAVPSQIFQVLTKRAKRCADMVLKWLQRRQIERLPSNIWIGFSAEDQEWFDKRWHYMQKLYPMVQTLWVSAEPLLGPIELGLFKPAYRQEQTQQLDMLKWIVVGGESGPNARPMNPRWARDLRDQCVTAGVPYFFKQYGEWAPPSATDEMYMKIACGDVGDMHIFEDRHVVYKVGKKTAGRVLDGQVWAQFPQEVTA
jgi:protein gp37